MKYRITAPQQKHWNASEGVWEPIPPYTSPRPIFGVAIKDGAGETDDRATAVEFVDMGYTVEPNPKEHAELRQWIEPEPEPAGKARKRR